MQSSLNLDSTTLGLIASSNCIEYLIGSFLAVFLKSQIKSMSLYMHHYSLYLLLFLWALPNRFIN